MSKQTQRGLGAIAPAQAGVLVREDRNLFGRARVTAGGSVFISFYYRFRFEGSLKDLSCRTWPADSLATIRGVRDAAREKVSVGINSALDKKIVRHEMQTKVAQKLTSIKAARVKDLNVSNLFAAWIIDGVRRKDGNAAMKRMFDADVRTAIGDTSVKDVPERDLRAVLRAIVERGVNRSAVIQRNNLTQWFAWVRKRQPWRKLLAEEDPMELMRPKDRRAGLRPRQLLRSGAGARQDLGTPRCFGSDASRI